MINTYCIGRSEYAYHTNTSRDGPYYDHKLLKLELISVKSDGHTTLEYEFV